MSASCELYSFLVTHSRHVKGVKYARKWRFRITIRQWTGLSRVYTTAAKWYVRASTGADGHDSPERNKISHYQRISMSIYPKQGGSVLETISLTKERKKDKESLKAGPAFVGLSVSKPIEASIPPSPLWTFAVLKSSSTSESAARRLRQNRSPVKFTWLRGLQAKSGNLVLDER